MNKPFSFTQQLLLINSNKILSFLNENKTSQYIKTIENYQQQIKKDVETTKQKLMKLSESQKEEETISINEEEETKEFIKLSLKETLLEMVLFTMNSDKNDLKEEVKDCDVFEMLLNYTANLIYSFDETVEKMENKQKIIRKLNYQIFDLKSNNDKLTKENEKKKKENEHLKKISNFMNKSKSSNTVNSMNKNKTTQLTRQKTLVMNDNNQMKETKKDSLVRNSSMSQIKLSKAKTVGNIQNINQTKETKKLNYFNDFRGVNNLKRGITESCLLFSKKGNNPNKFNEEEIKQLNHSKTHSNLSLLIDNSNESNITSSSNETKQTNEIQQSLSRQNTIPMQPINNLEKKENDTNEINQIDNQEIKEENQENNIDSYFNTIRKSTTTLLQQNLNQDSSDDDEEKEMNEKLQKMVNFNEDNKQIITEVIAEIKSLIEEYEKEIPDEIQQIKNNMEEEIEDREIVYQKEFDKYEQFKQQIENKQISDELKTRREVLMMQMNEFLFNFMNELKENLEEGDVNSLCFDCDQFCEYAWKYLENVFYHSVLENDFSKAVKMIYDFCNFRNNNEEIVSDENEMNYNYTINNDNNNEIIEVYNPNDTEEENDESSEILTDEEIPYKSFNKIELNSRDSNSSRSSLSTRLSDFAPQSKQSMNCDFNENESDGKEIITETLGNVCYRFSVDSEKKPDESQMRVIMNTIKIWRNYQKTVVNMMDMHHLELIDEVGETEF